MSYCPHSDKEIKEMLDVCGVSSVEELFSDIAPDLRPGKLSIEKGKSEFELMREMERLAARCPAPGISFTGGGFYDHFIPSAVDALSQMSGFLTSYTPYQSECSQGTLQALYEYQTAVCRLTGMDASNASVYDGGTALTEGIMMAARKTGRRKIVIDACVNPLYRDIVRTYFGGNDFDVVQIPPLNCGMDRDRFKAALDGGTAAAVIQNPNFFGTADDYSDVVKAAHSAGALAVGSFYPVALALLKSPGEAGFDIATGEGQSLGMPLSFGGPYLGYIASSAALARNLPGRIAGATTDEKGRGGFVLTLQAREQHIRRERASSNICSNQNLCALRALIYLSLLGKNGLAEIASLCRDKSEYAKELLAEIPGLKIKNKSATFNEFVFETDFPARTLLDGMAKQGIAGGIDLGAFYKEHGKSVLISFTEKNRKEDIDLFAGKLKEFLRKEIR
ncbi:MAG: aminomethyl-transferring glycine dehydrogenase subunit GcvPA [Elusimicrobiota bacterium]|nr:aminomethyl-transferring glycine dehydrogenase subunit GcvPA [Elusimicrobiota bacterium]